MELLFYVSRSGSFDENGSYLELGRVRVKLTPNPFAENATFKQEMKLREGFVEITGSTHGKSDAIEARIKVWVEVHKPLVHVDIDANKPVAVEAAYESWRTKDKELASGNYGERFSCFNLMAYSGTVMSTKDEISFTDKGILFYHRNPKQKLASQVLIQQQGLESEADKITDDLKNRTFGGIFYARMGMISEAAEYNTKKL